MESSFLIWITEGLVSTVESSAGTNDRYLNRGFGRRGRDEAPEWTEAHSEIFGKKFSDAQNSLSEPYGLFYQAKQSIPFPSCYLRKSGRYLYHQLHHSQRTGLRYEDRIHWLLWACATRGAGLEQESD